MERIFSLLVYLAPVMHKQNNRFPLASQFCNSTVERRRKPDDKNEQNMPEIGNYSIIKIFCNP